MQSLKKQVAPEAAAKQDISFRVLTISHNFFCVYAGAALIEIYADWVGANAHCQRLRNQQA
jgi:hypothetical protein